MKIKLGNGYYLNSDVYCYWITKEVQPTEKSRTQKVYEKLASGYSGTFEAAIDSFMEKKIGECEALEFKTLAKEIKELKEEVRSWKAAVERRE